jgi:hypothetical protein
MQGYDESRRLRVSAERKIQYSSFPPSKTDFLDTKLTSTKGKLSLSQMGASGMLHKTLLCFLAFARYSVASTLEMQIGEAQMESYHSSGENINRDCPFAL